MSKQYLLLFSISPVQSFIAQARKTQDLYAGSQILTELCRRGLQQATQIYQAKAIFPFDFNEKVKSLPNRFLVRVDSDDIKLIGNDIEKEVRKYWKEIICKDVIAFEQTNGITGILQQIENHLDIHWVYQEIKNTEGGYAFAFKEVDYLMSAVKNLRTLSQFSYQVTVGEMGRKCSVDGERNVKFYRLTEKEQSKKKDEDVNKNVQSLYENKLFSNSNEVFVDGYDNGKFKLSELQPGEGLSAVSMSKRKFNAETFCSTADIAMLYTVRYLFKFDCIQDTFNYRKKFDDLFKNINSFNAQLYFEENLTEHYFKNQGYSTLIPQLIPLKKERKALEDKAKKANYPFLKYYALIDFDGDNMGKWMNGDKEKVKKEIDLEDFHEKLSSRLSEFAKKAKKIVDSYGQTVYAGGDDFLGFINLNYLFKAMQELRNEYDTIVNIPLTEFRQVGQDFTFSSGICIAHYKEPLSVVLNKASLAQKTAKDEDKGNKNAFAITASKHSGESHEMYFQWESMSDNVNHLNCLVQNLLHETFSNTFIKTLNIEFTRLIGRDNDLLVSNDMLKAEVERTIWRSCMLKRNDDESKEDFKKRKEAQCILLSDIVMTIYHKSKGDFYNFLNALNICDFIHRLLVTGNDMPELTISERRTLSTFLK